jgi:hypothetical protein
MTNIYLWITIYFSHLVGAYWFGNFPLKTKIIWIRTVWGIILSSALAYMLAGDWANFWIPASVGLAVFIQNMLLTRISGKKVELLLLIEFGWMIYTLILSFVITPVRLQWLDVWGTTYYGILVLISSWTISAFPLGNLIGLLLKKYQGKMVSGFPSAGKMIGTLERSILFILFLINAPIGVGFLITAKTLFRFGEISKADDQKAVEYILIGTLLSFLLGMVITILAMLAADPFFAAWNFKLLGY